MLSLTVAQVSGARHGDADRGGYRHPRRYWREHRGAQRGRRSARWSANGIDIIDATDNVLSLTVAQYQALGTVTLTAADVRVTLADTGANIAALTAADRFGGLGVRNGIDNIDAS